MSSADGPGDPDRETPEPTVSALLGARTDTLLVETLIHLMVEKGLLTKNDALSIVQTVAQVRSGASADGVTQSAATEMEVLMLRRMYESFQSLAARPGDMRLEGDNIYPLRPPVHDGQPEFPHDD